MDPMIFNAGTLDTTLSRILKIEELARASSDYQYILEKMHLATPTKECEVKKIIRDLNL